MNDDQRFKNILLKKELIAQIYYFNNSGGIIFPTPDLQEMQCGYGQVSERKVIKPHIHKNIKRNIENTSEFIYIINGQMEVTFLSPKGKIITTEKIQPGEAFLQFKGGHKITFSANTRYFELKQGPYLGNAIDKATIN